MHRKSAKHQPQTLRHGDSAMMIGGGSRELRQTRQATCQRPMGCRRRLRGTARPGPPQGGRLGGMRSGRLTADHRVELGRLRDPPFHVGRDGPRPRRSMRSAASRPTGAVAGSGEYRVLAPDARGIERGWRTAATGLSGPTEGRAGVCPTSAPEAANAARSSRRRRRQKCPKGTRPGSNSGL